MWKSKVKQRANLECGVLHLTVAALSSNASLLKLSPSTGVITPTFSSTNFDYTLNVATTTQGLRLSFTAAPGASVSSATNEISDNTISVASACPASVISIAVLAEDRVARNNYTLNTACLGA